MGKSHQHVRAYIGVLQFVRIMSTVQCHNMFVVYILEEKDVPARRNCLPLPCSIITDSYFACVFFFANRKHCPCPSRSKARALSFLISILHVPNQRVCLRRRRLTHQSSFNRLIRRQIDGRTGKDNNAGGSTAAVRPSVRPSLHTRAPPANSTRRRGSWGWWGRNAAPPAYLSVADSAAPPLRPPFGVSACASHTARSR